MKRHNALAVTVAAVASLAVAVAVAFGTAPSGVSMEAHVEGAKLPKNVKVNADGIKFQTKGRTSVSVVSMKIAAGGTTGWHSHPGLAAIAVTEGTGKLYSSDCKSQTFSKGQAFVEAGNDPPTVFRNETSKPVALTVTFFAPKRKAVLRDEANPGCPIS